jgi:hypothetical protein
MSSECNLRKIWFMGATACALAVGSAQTAVAQAPIWTTPDFAVYPMIPAGSASAAYPPAPPRRTIPRAPLARVVRNPDTSSGLPPYALTDNTGTIQRYVEPVPGVDLEPYVGGVVRVRHDTGRTLLASQLDLPPQPLQPLTGDRAGRAPRSFVADSARPLKLVGRSAAPLFQTKFADNDDTTVQLVAEEEELPNGGPPSTPVSVPAAEPAESAGDSANSTGQSSDTASQPAEQENLALPEVMSEDAGPMIGDGMGGEPMYGDPSEIGDPGMMEMEGGDWGMEGEMVPGYDEYGMPPGYGDPQGRRWGPMGFQSQHSQRSQFYAEVELNFLRAHIMENFAGKLSEKYELSPRVILGFDGVSPVDGRARYWHYGRDTSLLGGGGIRLELDVLDLEATRGFVAGKAEILVAAGFRAAKIDLTDDDGDEAGSDLLGSTLATDLETPVCCYQEGQFFGVCGARVSLLGGDWGQNGSSDFIPNQLQDDNVVVQELYAGFGYGCCYRDMDLYSRLTFEVQNWHSDVLSQFAGGDSLGFLGPGIEFGAEF